MGPKVDNVASPTVRQNRDSLFDSRRRRQLKSSAATSATANEAAAIQESLSRTQNLLQSELSRVSAVQTAINDDDKMLRETMDTQKTMNVKGAKKALTALERAKQHEQRVLWISVVFFWVVVCYIMWCRILVRLPFVERIILSAPTVTREIWTLAESYINDLTD